MQVAQRIAGYSLAEADNLRKATRQEEPRRSSPRSGRSSWPAATRNGYGAAFGEQMFDVIEPFADYSFNKTPLLRLRLRLLPDGLPEGPPPGRVPGRPPHLGEGRQGQDGRLPQRVPGARHPRPRARRQRRPRATSSAKDGADPLRHVGRPQRRRGPRGPHRGRAGGERAVRLASTTSATGSNPTVLNKRALESLIKAGRLRLASATPARAC